MDSSAQPFERPHLAIEPAVSQPRPGPHTATSGDASSGAFRLAFVFFCLALVLAGPFAVGRFQYHWTYNALKAEVDAAAVGLAKIKPQMIDFMMASRLVAKRVSPSVVSIYRPGAIGPMGQGSGVIVDAAGYIVTNYHVVSDADNSRTSWNTDDQSHLRVRLSDGRERRAEIVGGDAGTDLAVLKVDLPNLVAAEWGNSDDLQVGDLVWALGSPFGLDRSITFGIVSAKGRRSGSGVTRYPYQEYLQTDAAVNPGNSGGPLVDLEGKIVGINTAIVGNSYQGVSFAIPSEFARKQYRQLLKKGWIERGYLGIQPLEVPSTLKELLSVADGEGVLVGRVERGMPADRAGIRTGDIILQWNEVPATDPTLLSRDIAATEVGSIARVLVARRRSSASEENLKTLRLQFDVTVGRHPDF